MATTNISDLPPNPRFSQKTTQKNNISLQITPQQEISEHIKQLSLPQRDIPRQQNHLVQDETIKPNYIPKPKKTFDYIKEEEQHFKKYTWNGQQMHIAKN